MNLLVKRGCDEVFQPLGEIVKIWGRVPFTPGSAPPPLQVRILQSVLHLILKCGGTVFQIRSRISTTFYPVGGVVVPF